MLSNEDFSDESLQQVVIDYRLPSPYSSQGRKQGRRISTFRGDSVLIQTLDPNRPDIAREVGENPLTRDVESDEGNLIKVSPRAAENPPQLPSVRHLLETSPYATPYHGRSPRSSPPTSQRSLDSQVNIYSSHKMGSAAFRPITSPNEGTYHPSHSTRLPSLSQVGIEPPRPYADQSHCPKSIDGEPVNPSWGLTKAGKARKRLAQACIPCREKKIKCHPNQSKCDQCQKSGRDCRFESMPRGNQAQLSSYNPNPSQSRSRQIIGSPCKVDLALHSLPPSSVSLSAYVGPSEMKNRSHDPAQTLPPMKEVLGDVNLSLSASLPPQRQTSSQPYVDVEPCELEFNSSFPGSVRTAAPARSPTDAVYECQFPGCKAAPFQDQHTLKSHAKVHSQHRPYSCAFPGCGRCFKRKNEMVRHGVVHSSSGYRCPFCTDQSHQYPRPDNLQRHVKSLHPDERQDDPQLRKILARRPNGSRRRGYA